MFQILVFNLVQTSDLMNSIVDSSEQPLLTLIAGSYVTHETKHFIYFYLGQIAVLLFKSG
jgi:hypothetical protein